MKSISEFSPFEKEQEQELFQKSENGDMTAREKIILSHLKLVVKIAMGYKKFGVAIEDLVEAGNIGLMRAVDKYDYRVGAKFSVFASFWINMMIKNELSKFSRAVSLSTTIYSKQKKAKKIAESMEGDANVIDEIAKALNTKNVRYAKAIKDGTSSFSVHETIDGDDSGHEYIETMADEKSDFIGAMEYQDSVRQIVKMIEYLEDKREREIIKRRFGIGCVRQDVKELAIEFELTHQRISQIEHDAIRHLKEIRDKLEKELVDLM